MIVNGMACAHCKARVEAALNAVAGVEKAEVTLEEKKAVVTCSQPVEDSALIQAVTATGGSVIFHGRINRKAMASQAKTTTEARYR